MTAFLARLDGHLIKALSSEGFVEFLIWLADLAARGEDLVSKLEARWAARENQRTPEAPVSRGRHRVRGRTRFWTRAPVAKFDRDDYEWGRAIRTMARNMEGSWTAWQ